MAAPEIPLAGFRTKLLSRSNVVEGTMAFHFAKPLGFNFKDGQATDLTLLNPPETDSEGNIRTFISEVLSWLNYLDSQCPECTQIEWPTDD